MTNHKKTYTCAHCGTAFLAWAAYTYRTRKTPWRPTCSKSCKTALRSAEQPKVKKCSRCEKERGIRSFGRFSGGGTRKVCRPCLNSAALPARQEKMYGLGKGVVGAMLAQQNNACAVCQKPFVRTHQVDHCHTTGRVRGLLCFSCNAGLGVFKDDANLMEKAVAYLRR